ncbi:MAG TPA: S8/S53 family peptidase [Propionicimonas sp.]|uniref:S8/S53 family peptidase n=1 Tax=Propionicimonas sp. TaxID=1955623 RepID=UPI002F3E6BA2
MIRVLDPASAVVGPTGVAPLPTLYVADQLMVRGQQAVDGLDERVAKVIAELGWVLGPPKREQPGLRAYVRTDLAAGLPPRAELPGVKLVSRPPLLLEISAERGRPAAAVDAWVALQQIAASLEPEIAGAFELNHVLLPAGGGYWGGIGGGYWGGIGGGYWGGIGGGYWGGIGGGLGPAEYGVPGFGGKTPVALIVADPALSARVLDRPPVVVMPDTGIGPHPWFPRELTKDVFAPKAHPPQMSLVTVVGTEVPDDSTGVGEPLTGGADRLAGHGTFIAGIVRQACPEARLEAHTVMSSAGVIIESELITLLHTLLHRQLTALATANPELVVDVLSISAGYYHESPEDTPIDTSIAEVLGDLGRAGVVVIAGAGNDATERPLLPAGLAKASSDPSELPLLSVGSLNPNGTTVALFSNAGPWVTTYRSGAAIVSTLPTSGNAGTQSSTSASGGSPDKRARTTIDADDFSGGFGVWSGTSFAAPLLAGEVARTLVELGTDDVSLSAMLERGRKAVALVLEDQR